MPHGGLRVVQRWVFSQEYFKTPQASERHWCWLSLWAENSVANITQSSLKMDIFRFDSNQNIKLTMILFKIQPILQILKFKIIYFVTSIINLFATEVQKHDVIPFLTYFIIFDNFIIYNSKLLTSVVHFVFTKSWQIDIHIYRCQK